MSIFAQFCWVLVEFSNFRNFLLDEFYSNLKSRVESALKIIQNDTDIPYELSIFGLKIDFLIFV